MMTCGRAWEMQMGSLNTIDYISSLFTSSPKEVFTREEVLVVLNLVKNDRELHDPGRVIEWDAIATAYDAEGR